MSSDPKSPSLEKSCCPWCFFLDTEHRGQASKGREGDSLSSVNREAFAFPGFEAPHCAQNSRSTVLMHGQERTLHAS